MFKSLITLSTVLLFLDTIDSSQKKTHFQFHREGQKVKIDSVYRNLFYRNSLRKSYYSTKQGFIL